MGNDFAAARKHKAIYFGPVTFLYTQTPNSWLKGPFRIDQGPIATDARSVLFQHSLE
jgi:hypothetical protein